MLQLFLAVDNKIFRNYVFLNIEATKIRNSILYQNRVIKNEKMNIFFHQNLIFILIIS